MTLSLSPNPTKPLKALPWWRREYLTLSYRLTFFREFAFHLKCGLNGEQALEAVITSNADYFGRTIFQHVLDALAAGKRFDEALRHTNMLQGRDLEWLANRLENLSLLDRLEILIGRLERTAKFWHFSTPNFWFHWVAFVFVAFTLFAYGDKIYRLSDESSVWRRFASPDALQAMQHLIWQNTLLVNIAILGAIAMAVYLIGFGLYFKTRLGRWLSPFLVTRSLLYRFLAGDALFSLAQLVRRGIPLDQAASVLQKTAHPLMADRLRQAAEFFAAGAPPQQGLAKLLPIGQSAGSADYYQNAGYLADWLDHLASRTIRFSSELYGVIKFNIKMLAEIFIVLSLSHIFWTTQTLTNLSLDFSMASLATSAQTLQELQSETRVQPKPQLQPDAPQGQPVQPQQSGQQPAPMPDTQSQAPLPNPRTPIMPTNN
ncbi:MAG: hypothetical protein FJX22_03235 [Alphaproteobacteria bacterium]|nr:hypothetical protein [Alphaproteobacteria bacterium]